MPPLISLEDQIDAQKELISHTYGQATAYTNIIFIAGYAGFFGLWKLTEGYLLKSQVYSSALLITISITSFVLFEVYQMSIRSIKILALAKTIEDPNTYHELIAEFKTGYVNSMKKLKGFWIASMIICLSTGIGGVGILGYSFICGLYRTYTGT